MLLTQQSLMIPYLWSLYTKCSLSFINNKSFLNSLLVPVISSVISFSQVIEALPGFFFSAYMQKSESMFTISFKPLGILPRLLVILINQMDEGGDYSLNPKIP